MSQDAVLVGAIQEVLGDVIDRLADEHGLNRRAGKLSGGAFARTLILTALRKPDATLDEMAQTAALVAEPVSPQALHQRFTADATDHLKACLEAAVRKVVKADQAVAVALLDRFTEVDVQDSTTIQLPDVFRAQYRGCGGTAPTVAASALKFQVRFDLKRGGLQGFRIEQGTDADVATPLQTQDILAGSLHLRDLGYFDASVLRAIASQNASYLSRLRHPIVVFDEAGNRLSSLSGWLTGKGTAVVDANVTVGVAERLACRLIAVRVPPQTRAKRLKDLRKQGKKKGYTPSLERVALCEWDVSITNLPTAMLSVAEASALRRLRWQVELLFKQWKSVGLLDESRSGRPDRVLCEVFAKMVALVIQHAILVRSCWQYANRSLVRATKAVRCLAGALATAWRDREKLGGILAQIARQLEKTGRIERRRKNPSAFQVIDNPNDCGYMSNRPHSR